MMFATLKRKVYAQIRAEGHAKDRQEGDARWRAWWHGALQPAHSFLTPPTRRRNSRTESRR